MSIETGKLAKQADGAVIVRSGDTMVIVTACHAATPRVGIDFLPLTVDYREYTYASGPDSRRLLQARGQAGREGSADEPPDRSADPAALPGRLVLRDADRRAADLGRHRERLGRARDHRRVGGAGALVDPVPEDDRRRARRPRSTAQYVINPTYAERKTEQDRPGRRRQRRRDHDGRGRRQGGDRRRDGRRARAPPTRRSSRSSRRSTTSSASAASRRRRSTAKEHRPRVLPRGRGEGLHAARRGDAHQGQARELRHAWTGARRTRREHSRRRSRAPHRRQDRSSRT